MSLTTITVTASDIKRGKRGQPCSCPIALAINRHLTRGWRASVGKPSWSVVNRPMEVDLDGPTLLPRKAVAFITAFDGRVADDRYPKPITFKLRIPKEALA